MACSFYVQNKLGNELQSCSNLVSFPPITNLTALCQGLSMLMSLNCPERPHLGPPPTHTSYPGDQGLHLRLGLNTSFFPLSTSLFNLCLQLCLLLLLPGPLDLAHPLPCPRLSKDLTLSIVFRYCGRMGSWWVEGMAGAEGALGSPLRWGATLAVTWCNSILPQYPSSWWGKDKIEHNWRVTNSNLCFKEAVYPPGKHVCGCGIVYWSFTCTFHG